MPHHNPPQLTDIQLDILTLIQGASRALSQSEIARRVAFNVPDKKANKVLHYNVTILAKAGLIICIRENARVVKYVRASPEFPKFERKKAGRKSSLTMKIKRLTVVAPDGSSFTMLDTGFLTQGVRHVQDGKHDVNESANDDQEGDALDARRCGGAGC